MKLGQQHKCHKGRAAIRHYDNQPASRHFQPGEGPSRDLLCDCKTSRNLQEHSFEALASSDQDQGQYI